MSATIPYTELEVEYSQLMLSQNILKLVYSTTTSTHPRAKGELKNCLEQWAMSLYNASPSPLPSSKTDATSTWATVYRNLPRHHPVHLKLETSLLEKNRELSRHSCREVVDCIVKMVHDLVTLPVPPPLPYIASSAVPTTDAHLDAQSQVVARVQTVPEKIKYERTDRMARLPALLKVGEEEVLKLVMRHLTLFEGGQQLGFTQSHFEALYKWGVRVEGFTSLLNSRLVGKPGCTVVTIDGAFYTQDTSPPPDSQPSSPLVEDKTMICPSSRPPSTASGFFDAWETNVFNSKWPNNRMGIQVNPPFIEDILTQAAIKSVELIELAMRHSRDLKIFFHGPHWKDAEFHKILIRGSCTPPFTPSSSPILPVGGSKGGVTPLVGGSKGGATPFMIGPIRLPAHSYLLEKPNGETITANVDNLYYCLSSTPVDPLQHLELLELLSTFEKVRETSEFQSGH